MSKDIKEPQTLFEWHGKLYETVGHSVNGDTVVWIQPVRERDYEKCECGRPLPNQQHGYVLYSPLLQEGIGKVYKVAPSTQAKGGKR